MGNVVAEEAAEILRAARTEKPIAHAFRFL